MFTNSIPSYIAPERSSELKGIASKKIKYFASKCLSEQSIKNKKSNKGT